MSAPQPLGGPVEYARDDVDLGELLDILLEGKWLILAATLLTLLLGLVYAVLATPIYEADALVQLEGESSSLGAVFGEMGDVLSESSEATAEIELIKSRLVLGRTIEQLELDTVARPVYFPLIGQGVARLAARDVGPAKLLTQFFIGPYAQGEEDITLGRFEVPDGRLGESFYLQAGETEGSYALWLNEEESVVGRVGETLRVEGRDIVIQVQSLRSPPGHRFEVKRRDMLSAIASLRENLSVAEKGKDSGIISLRLQHPDPERAQRILNAIANNYLRQNVERKGEEAEQTLKYLQQQLPALRARLEASEVQLNAYRTRQGSADLLQETQLLLRQSAELEALRLTLAQEREQLLQRFQPGHPSVQALDAQLRDLEQNRTGLESEIRDLPETQQELLRLTRDVQVNTELYTSLLNSAQQLEVAKAGTVGTVRIVDYAGRPREPVKPKRKLILMLSLMLGAFLGLAAVFVRRALFSTIDDPQSFEAHFGLPVFANIPISKVQKTMFGKVNQLAPGLHTLQRRTADDPALEALKSLRTALHFGMHEAQNNIVLITGPRPGLGKSFVAANLASTIASAGKSAVVVDGDMRRGTVHTYAGIKRKPGLSDVLSERATLDEALRPTEQEGLMVLPTGTLPPNPSELLSTPLFHELLQELRTRFDVVLIDSPPNLAVADANILAQIAGTTLLVLRADLHPPREVAESIKRLKMVGANVRGAIFNMVRYQARRYGYGRYNYHYGYGKAKS